ncbi:UDP-N-acetylmuramoyl-L-alanine--D-glutamate ligase [Pistricoccus aurantiacus]|uniref:UDP-N-acetylmuramoyl-L-alanine--D-glutamate ligase n=1 Tax=Pistricoccus aurantiacus TaxID=1883414 RepID=UPI00363B4F0C
MIEVPEDTTLVVGLGVSGTAIARYLTRLGRPFMMADTRSVPPGLAAFQKAYPQVAVHCGPLTELNLCKAREVVLSPGVDPRTPGLEGLAESLNPVTGEPRLVGEIALFRRALNKRANPGRVAAITGSNAKSTVTTLLGDMARNAGIDVAVGGNLGTPALDLLHEYSQSALFVLELSSFQLEMTPRLEADSVAFLNLSEDHLDRHGSLDAYRRAKSSIFRGAGHAVVNVEEPLTWPDDPALSADEFTTQPPLGRQWGIGEPVPGQGAWLMHGDEALLACSRVKLKGRHHQANALAALAMGHQLGLPMKAMLEVLERFEGLPHRCEVIVEVDGVSWINDSKGTNVGATLAAINGLGPTLTGKLILLAGGQGKGADFSPLGEPLSRYARRVLTFGIDGPRLADAVRKQVSVSEFAGMNEALEQARRIVEPGDCVLLSPACASLDQFPSYIARGETFRRWVLEQVSGQIEESNS